MALEGNYFYVDEAGDLTLFDRVGRNLVGTEGVSKCFMVGLAHIADPLKVRRAMDKLRHELVNDEYLKSIPSMQPAAEKTARAFHAKDDCTEARMAVFKLLSRQDIKVQIGIRRKSELVKVARNLHASGMKLNQNQVYDNLVKTLFKPVLHKAEQNTIYFARRGKSGREEALAHAIARSQDNFERDTGITADRPTRIIPSVPSEEAGLQAVDYYLWALQRMYERGEDRYFQFLKKQYRLIMDFDDKRNQKPYGTWYSDSNLLTLKKMLPVSG